MLKLLIVDDERLVRELIQRCIDWTEVGFEIVGTASTAAEALQMVDELHPDVVFTDVRMPQHTGLEFGREVLEKYSDLKIVVISGYDEFSYVNEGLKMGIFDYILKPIAQEVLLDVACRVRDAVLEERKHHEEFDRLKKELEQNFEIIREKYIERLVGSENAEIAAENLDFFNIHLNEQCYQAAVLEYRTDEEINQENDLLKPMQIREITEAYFAEDTSVFLFEKHFRRLGIIDNQPELDFVAACDRLKALIHQKTGIWVRIGIGNKYEDIRQLSVSYREAMDVLSYGFAAEADKSMQYRELFGKFGENPVMQESIYQNFAYYMKQAMFKEAKDNVSAAFFMLKNTAIKKEQAALLAMHYVMEIFSTTAELKVSFLQEDKDETSIIYELLQISNLGDMGRYIENLLDLFVQKFRKQNETKNISIVQTTENYLKDNYEDPDLSLALVAKMLYVNPNYLSRTFKEKTGKTFREYLLDVRMEKALLLLRQTSLKSYEVAEKVGVKDPGYFSLCFKKKFGQSVQSMLRAEN